VKRGEIWKTRFPDGKLRPGVIVSHEARNIHGENIILAGCTSRRTKTIYPTELLLEGHNLPVPTKVQADYLFTVKKQNLHEKLGKLFAPEVKKLNSALASALQLPLR
jgi:mRNA-degrading endonuclease toxin of MazEF toxin-antitoxin module